MDTDSLDTMLIVAEQRRAICAIAEAAGIGRESWHLETIAADVTAELKKLRRELTHQRENNHLRNIQLDALHFVWCSGGCGGGTHRWTDAELTAEIVAEAMHNTTRLYSRFVNLAGREDKEGSVAKRRPLWERARLRVAEAVMQLAVPPGATP